MPPVELTPVKITLDGITPAPAVVEDDGNWFTNTGRCFIHLVGGGIGGGALKMTVNSQAECNFGHDHDIECTPLAGIIHLIGPFPRSRFDDADNKVQITYGAGCEADNMLIQILELP